MSILRVFLRLALIVLLASTSSCGRGYRIEGRIVLIPGFDDGESRIEEVTGKELPTQGSPLSGAKVLMFMQMDSRGNPKPDSVWETTTTTDSDGRFKLYMYAAPYDNVPVGLQVTKDGYKTVVTKYIDFSKVEPQVFYVVLVPNRVSQAMPPGPALPLGCAS